ncbi:MAG: AAA family ATPase [Verrucomicrobiia bacterium]
MKNYRCISDAVVEFSGNPILLSGPNESGKSTLIEAAHRGLFLRSKTTGQVVESMRSAQGDVPEVELEFETGQGRFTLHKVFAGGRGAAKLRLPEGGWLQDGEAEDRMARLLGAGETIGGGGALGALERRWAHLWVWQGRSGTDPMRDLAEVQGALVDRLRVRGGAGALQSSLDRRVHEGLKAEVDSLVRGNKNEPKAGTLWARLRAEVAQLEEEKMRLVAEVSQLERAMALRGEAEKALATTVPELVEAERAREATRKRREEVQRLQAELEAVRLEMGVVEEERKRLEKQAADLQEAESLIPRLRQEREERLKEEAATRGGLETVEQQVEDLERAVADARAEAEAVRVRRDLVLAETAATRAREDVERVERRIADLQKAAERVKALRDQIGLLPPVTPQLMGTLEGRRDRLVRAKVAVEAVAAAVRVIEAGGDLRVGGQAVAAGQEFRFSGPFEIEVPSLLHLRVTPGGGATLEEALEEQKDAERSLEEALAEAGVISVEAARETLVRRQVLEKEVLAEEARLKEAGADEVEAERAAAVQSVATASARLDLIRVSAARVGEGRSDDQAVEEADERVRRLKGERDAAVVRRGQAVKRLEAAAGALRLAQETLRDAETRLATLVETGSSTAVLGVRRAEVEGKWKELMARAERGKLHLQTLGAGMIEEEMEMRENAVTRLRHQVEAARLKQAEAQALLERDGARDPVTELEGIKERLDRVQRAEHAERARVATLQRLLVLFDEAERALEQQFTEPLLSRVAGYLAPIFGPSARVEASYREGRFSDLFLNRTEQQQGRFGFEQLSAGAREQVAVAFRLAVAEILAESHDGCLPLALDDALVNADPERMKGLLLMLHRATKRGLQLIVVTCQPSEYSALGGTVVSVGSGLLGYDLVAGGGGSG